MTMTGLVSLEQARMLAALGMEQGISHHRWYWWGPGAFEHLTEPELSCPGAFGSGVWYDGSGDGARRHEVEWCDAPTLLEALEWCETQGWRWARNVERRWFYWGPRDDILDGLGPFYSPSALLDAVLLRLTGVTVPEHGAREGPLR